MERGRGRQEPEVRNLRCITTSQALPSHCTTVLRQWIRCKPNRRQTRSKEHRAWLNPTKLSLRQAHRLSERNLSKPSCRSSKISRTMGRALCCTLRCSSGPTSLAPASTVANRPALTSISWITTASCSDRTRPMQPINSTSSSKRLQICQPKTVTTTSETARQDRRVEATHGASTTKGRRATSSSSSSITSNSSNSLNLNSSRWV